MRRHTEGGFMTQPKEDLVNIVTQLLESPLMVPEDFDEESSPTRKFLRQVYDALRTLRRFQNIKGKQLVHGKMRNGGHTFCYLNAPFEDQRRIGNDWDQEGEGLWVCSIELGEEFSPEKRFALNMDDFQGDGEVASGAFHEAIEYVQSHAAIPTPPAYLAKALSLLARQICRSSS
jgi:hypothetical protein